MGAAPLAVQAPKVESGARAEVQFRTLPVLESCSDDRPDPPPAGLEYVELYAPLRRHQTGPVSVLHSGLTAAVRYIFGAV